MKIKPLNDRVLVLRIDEEEKTSGGIIIPDTAKEKPQRGKIVVTHYRHDRVVDNPPGTRVRVGPVSNNVTDKMDFINTQIENGLFDSLKGLEVGMDIRDNSGSHCSGRPFRASRFFSV